MKRPKGPSTWMLYTYDVWGNRRDGYEVNDTYTSGEVSSPLLQPSDSWLAGLCGLRNDQVDIDGDDNYITVNRRSDGKPLCHLERV
jgi:hypothetical protein